VIKKSKNNRTGQGNAFLFLCGKCKVRCENWFAGPTAYICDECIELCRYIVEEEGDNLVEKDSQKACRIRKKLEILPKFRSKCFARTRRNRSGAIAFLISIPSGSTFRNNLMIYARRQNFLVLLTDSTY